ncbi:MAG: hypothetical protein MPJ78_11945 [Hyphomicrobiaceae bacterium]|nr:hypothetical protein [Hyphomicrobiaceae bacterium]
MAEKDTCVTLVPYFKVHEGKLQQFKDGCAAFIEKTSTEPACVHYAFSFNGDEAHCREGYDHAEGVLAHLDNVGELLQQALQIADITRLEVHGPADELEKLKEPLKELSPAYFELHDGIRR